MSTEEREMKLNFTNEKYFLSLYRVYLSVCTKYGE